MIKIQNNQRGFTLLETLVAISIVTLTIVGPLAMAAQASRLIDVAKSQLTANYLAQEALELVRYKRDTNMILANANTDPDVIIDWLTGDDPQGGLFGCISDSREDKCYVDANIGSDSPPSFYSCEDIANGCITTGVYEPKTYLVLTEDGYKYDLNGTLVSGGLGKQTSFLRFIQIERFKMGPADPEAAGSGAKVKIKVMWVDTYGPKTLYVQENIYKYR